MKGDGVIIDTDDKEFVINPVVSMGSSMKAFGYEYHEIPARTPTRIIMRKHSSILRRKSSNWTKSLILLILTMMGV